MEKCLICGKDYFRDCQCFHHAAPRISPRELPTTSSISPIIKPEQKVIPSTGMHTYTCQVVHKDSPYSTSPTFYEERCSYETYYPTQQTTDKSIAKDWLKQSGGQLLHASQCQGDLQKDSYHGAQLLENLVEEIYSGVCLSNVSECSSWHNLDGETKICSYNFPQSQLDLSNLRPYNMSQLSQCSSPSRVSSKLSGQNSTRSSCVDRRSNLPPSWSLRDANDIVRYTGIASSSGGVNAPSSMVESVLNSALYTTPTTLSPQRQVLVDAEGTTAYSSPQKHDKADISQFLRSEGDSSSSRQPNGMTLEDVCLTVLKSSKAKKSSLKTVDGAKCLLSKRIVRSEDDSSGRSKIWVSPHGSPTKRYEEGEINRYIVEPANERQIKRSSKESTSPRGETLSATSSRAVAATLPATSSRTVATALPPVASSPQRGVFSDASDTHTIIPTIITHSNSLFAGASNPPNQHHSSHQMNVSDSPAESRTNNQLVGFSSGADVHYTSVNVRQPYSTPYQENISSYTINKNDAISLRRSSSWHYDNAKNGAGDATQDGPRWWYQSDETSMDVTSIILANSESSGYSSSPKSSAGAMTIGEASSSNVREGKSVSKSESSKRKGGTAGEGKDEQPTSLGQKLTKEGAKSEGQDSSKKSGHGGLKLNDVALDCFACVICLDLATPPVYQCSRGHLLCNKCVKRVSKCPTCGAPDVSIRCRAVELFTEKMEVDCAYKSLGCNYRVKCHRKESHERNCPYRPLECLFSSCFYQGSPEELVNHLTVAHNYERRKTNKLELHCSNSNRMTYMGLATVNPEFSLWQDTIYSCFDKHFVLRVHRRKDKCDSCPRFYISVIVLHQKHHANNYRVAVRGSGREFTYEGPVWTASRGFEEMEKVNDCLTLPENIVFFLAGGTGLETSFKEFSFTVTGEILE